MVLPSLHPLAVVAVLLLNLFTAASTVTSTTTAAAAITYEDFQQLKVKEAIASMTKFEIAKTNESHDDEVVAFEEKDHSSSSSSTEANGKWKLKLLHQG